MTTRRIRCSRVQRINFTLKTQDAHFQRKFNEHNQLDEEIKQLENVASDFNDSERTQKPESYT